MQHNLSLSLLVVSAGRLPHYVLIKAGIKSAFAYENMFVV